jgi:hypothetical protein
MAEEKTPTRLELVYDAANKVYKAKLPSWMLGPNPYPALKSFEFTEEDLAKMPGLSFIYKGKKGEDGQRVGAYIEFGAANNYAQENYSAATERPSKREVTPDEARRLREGEITPDQQYAYRQGRVVTERNIDEFVQIDPVTRQVRFITSDAPGADIVGGTAEGGVPSPTFALIIPREFGMRGEALGTGAMVYDASVAQESFTKRLISTNKLTEFKNMLVEKGYYLLAGFGDIETQTSVRQGDTADEYFGIALNRYLNELSQRNYQNVKQGLNPFKIDDYIKTVQPDYDALSAYVPSERDAEKALKATYANYVGRMPSAEELSAFKLALESEAKSKPRVTQPDFATGMQTTYEGFTADQLDAFATEYTLERPEAEEFGAGQGGLNAISNVFGRIVQNARNEMANVVSPGSL